MIEGKIKAYFSDRPELTVSTLKAADINRFYEYLFSYDVSANTVIHYHVVLHRAFKQAFKDEQIDSNPFDRIDRPKKEKFEGDHYSKEELHALLEVARDDPIYPAIILAGCMGLRRSEAIGAKWSNIDWEADPQGRNSCRAYRLGIPRPQEITSQIYERELIFEPRNVL